MIEPRMERINVRDATLECVDEFCYLGDMIGARSGVEASSMMRVRCGWKKFELLPLLTTKELSLCIKRSLYAACVRSVMLYGSETWVVKEENILYVGLSVMSH